METKKIITDRLECLIKEAYKTSDALSARELAEYLAIRSVIAAPVEIGQEVYAVCAASFHNDAHCIEPWKVEGIKLGADGRLYAFDHSEEEFVIGERYCIVDRAEAEEYLIKAELGNKK